MPTVSICLQMCSICSIIEEKKAKNEIITYLCRSRREVNMKKEKPVNLALNMLNQLGIIENTDYRFINQEVGIVTSFIKMKSKVFHIGQPYRIKEGRVMRVLRGQAKFSVNLMEYTLKDNDMAIAPPGSLVQISTMTPDYDAQMIAVDNDFLPTIHRESLTDSYQMHGIVVHLTKKEWEQAGEYIKLIWETVQEKPFRKEIVQHLITALLYYIMYIDKRNQDTFLLQASHQEKLFRRFVALVNEYGKNERSVGFYADKLCLTPRYLSTVIRQVSQRTVTEWINQAVTLEAKVLLKHSDLLVYQISDELRFPNPSFFSKFFKRMTGMTPQEYQKETNNSYTNGV